ncbi:MAG: queuosine precursor transporter, partial [Mariniphaga sp.]|nr:queuosine precursor transporter [Mariniphaga sp.]
MFNEIELKGNVNKLMLLASIFVAALLTSNVIAVKLFTMSLSMNLFLTTAVFVYPVSFLCTDVISEVWGKKIAAKIVRYGFISNIVLFLFIYLAKILPAAPFWPHQEAYNTILGAVPRIILASMVAYLVSQHWDVWFFHKVKEWTSGKHLWLRNNLSTMTSQVFDTILFIGIAFWGVMPLGALATMAILQYLIKFAY